MHGLSTVLEVENLKRNLLYNVNDGVCYCRLVIFESQQPVCAILPHVCSSKCLDITFCVTVILHFYVVTSYSSNML